MSCNYCDSSIYCPLKVELPMEGNTTHKNFSFNWIIDDYQFYTEQIIQSTAISIQPFSGVFWCLRVKLLNPGNVASLDCYLYRIPSEPGPDFIFVDFDLKVSGSAVQSSQQSFKDAQFMNVDPYPNESPSLKLNVGVIRFPVLSSELVVNCEIYRYQVEQSYTTRFYHANSLCLSSDLYFLKKNRYFTDLTLIVQRHVFLTHKVILEARLPLMGKVININYLTESEIEVFGISPDVMESLLHYAYTGSLNRESYNNLQELYSIAGLMQLIDLQRLLHTSANKCTAKTLMNMQRKSFTFILKHGLDWSRENVLGTIIIPHEIGYAQCLSVTWGAISHDGLLFLQLKFQFPFMITNHCIFMMCTFRVMLEKACLHSGTFHNLFLSNEVWSTGPLVNKRFLDNYDWPITFEFDIDLCDGEARSFIEVSTAEIEYPLPIAKNIERLSYDLQNLFTTAKHSDLTLVTEYEMEIRAHKCILATRSGTFHNLIKKMHGQNSVLPLNGISNQALIFLLHYIYSGKTKNLNLTNVQEFNGAAKYFNIPALVDETNFFVESIELPS